MPRHDSGAISSEAGSDRDPSSVRPIKRSRRTSEGARGVDVNEFEGVDLAGISRKFPEEKRTQLAARIDHGTPIARGSENEVLLRAATVWAAQIVGDALRERAAASVTQAQLDYYCWRLAVRRDACGELPPFHRTRCTAY